MTSTIILDTDFLSAFLKIEQMPLIREFYRVDQVYVPQAVYREVALTDLLPRLLSLFWIKVEPSQSDQVQALLKEADFRRLGAGEQEAIALAMESEQSVLLMNDNQARRLAVSRGVTVVNIPAFLLACKKAELLDQPVMRQLVDDLQTKDYYGFRQDVLELLLS